MTTKTKTKTKQTKNKKEVVILPLAQRIDFTNWLKENPRMRPKRKKGNYRGKTNHTKRNTK